MRFKVAWESSLSAKNALPAGTKIGSEVVKSVNDDNRLSVAIVYFESGNSLWAMRGLSAEGQLKLANGFVVADHPDHEKVVDLEKRKPLVLSDLDIILKLASNNEAVVKYNQNRATAHLLEGWEEVEMKALEAEILSNPTFFQGIEGKVKEVAAKVSSGVGSVASRVSTVLPDTKVVEKMGDLATSVTRGLPEVRSAAQGAAKKAAEGAKEVWGKMFPVRREVSVDRAPYDDQALATEKEFHEGEEPESPKTPQ